MRLTLFALAALLTLDACSGSSVETTTGFSSGGIASGTSGSNTSGAASTGAASTTTSSTSSATAASSTTASASSSTATAGPGSTTAGTTNSTAAGSTGSSTTAGTIASTGTTATTGPGATSSGTTAGATTAATTAAATTASSTTGGNATTGGTTSGTTGGASTTSGGACQTSGGSPGGASCTQSTDCACPNDCLVDPAYGTGGKACELPCTTTSDCTDSVTVCRNGACNYDLCAYPGTLPDSGTNGVFDGPCASDTLNDGTCFAFYLPDAGSGPVALWYCEQAGAVAFNAACDAFEDRTNPSSLCAEGSVCFSNDGGAGGSCLQLCDPTADANTCASGYGCSPQDLTDDLATDWGVCVKEGGSGVCVVTGVSSEFEPCGPNAQCGCVTGSSFECVSDTTLANNVYQGVNQFGTQSFCERACTGTEDCPAAYSACVNGRCSYNFCGDVATGAGASARCNAADAGDGTCQVIATADADPAYAVCVQGGPGTFGSTCSPEATRTGDPTALCSPGYLCLDFGNDTNECGPICSPTTGGGTCAGNPSGTICDTGQFGMTVEGPLGTTLNFPASLQGYCD